MAELRLRTVTRTSGANAALKDGTVAPHEAVLDFVEIPVLVQGFRRMVRELEFDVSEMALTTYLAAREHGVRFTALPVFLVRQFHHGAIRVRPGSGVREPKQLEGRRVGVNRGYTVTTGVWARGVLADEYGVDLDEVTWVLSGDEHVAEYRPPANVVPMPAGGDLAAMLAAGELAAAIGVDAADTVPLIDDPEETGLAALRAGGVFPINHLVVVRDDVLAAHPELAADLFTAFAEAKNRYVDRLRADAVPEPTSADRTYRRVLEATGADPLPYGVEPNRATLEKLLDHAVAQHILTRRPSVESLFAAGSLDLTA
jgi:ABC-type nitrate/sulfonate/bicarbonate transport system substrate-binding protein